jgi:hypothetical protein
MKMKKGKVIPFKRTYYKEEIKESFSKEYYLSRYAFFLPVKYAYESRYERYYVAFPNGHYELLYDTSNYVQVSIDKPMDRDSWVYPTPNQGVPTDDEKFLEKASRRYMYLRLEDAHGHLLRDATFTECSSLFLCLLEIPLNFRFTFFNGDQAYFDCDRVNQYGLKLDSNLFATNVKKMKQIDMKNDLFYIDQLLERVPLMFMGDRNVVVTSPGEDTLKYLVPAKFDEHNATNVSIPSTHFFREMTKEELNMYQIELKKQRAYFETSDYLGVFITKLNSIFMSFKSFIKKDEEV